MKREILIALSPLDAFSGAIALENGSAVALIAIGSDTIGRIVSKDATPEETAYVDDFIADLAEACGYVITDITDHLRAQPTRGQA